MMATADIPMSVKAMKAGAADFLTKPFRQQETLDAVTAAISSSPAWVVRQAALLFKGMSQHLRGPAAENVATRTGAATYVEWLFLQPVENPRPHSGRTALRKLREICLTSTRCAPRLGLFA
jgi:hypothetical protein